MRQFYNIYIHKWQMAEKVHRIIHNKRNTIEHQDTCIPNKSVTYLQSIRIHMYFKSIINKVAKFLQETIIIRI